MQVGIVLAIKTLAERFEPLNEVYREFIGDALLAEDAGFDFVSTSEHHFEADAWSPSQLPVLAYLAARTSRMRLHTNVFLLPLHDPLRVSEDAATVDILSGHLAASRQQAWDECREGWWNWQNEYRKRSWIAMTDIGGVPPLPPLAELTEPPAGMFAPLLGTPDDILTVLEPMLKDSDCTHFSFAFRSSGGGMPIAMARQAIELFAKEVLPVLRSWGRDPVSSRAKD